MRALVLSLPLSGFWVKAAAPAIDFSLFSLYLLAPVRRPSAHTTISYLLARLVNRQSALFLLANWRIDGTLLLQSRRTHALVCREIICVLNCMTIELVS